MCYFYYSLVLRVVGYPCMVGNFPMSAEGFEMKGCEGRVIISFYLLRNAHDGKFTMCGKLSSLSCLLFGVWPVRNENTCQ